MMEILNYPHPLLRFKTHPLKRVDGKIKHFAQLMVEVMQSERGIGLSANQVGLPFSMFVVHWHGKNMCFINPTIKPYGKMKTKDEGCLSFPDMVLGVPRRSKCRFTAWDLNGDDIDEEVNNDLCRVLQHEIDHLEGILFIDRLSDMQRKSRTVAPHVRAMKAAWKRCPKGFPTDAFNKLLYDYCDVGSPPPLKKD